MENAILTQAKALKKQIIEDRRWLHQYPGVGFDLQETKEYVRKRLTDMGYSPVDCGRCGLITEISGGSGPTILLRADMDALPMREEADVDFAATNGNMHACGHDMHTAMLLGAARILMDNRQSIHGTVRLMFQPAEEILSGARDMIANGVLTDVNAAVMIHVAAPIPIPAGTVIVAAPGVTSPSAEYFTVRVHGKGCHGSMPQNGVDALTAAAHILIALQEIHARELPAADEAVLTVGSFHGGTAGNAIADQAELCGTIRAYDEQTHALLKRRLEEISRGIASTFRAEAEVEFGSSCPTLKNDPQLCESFHNYLVDLLGPQGALSAAAQGSSVRSGGSEDFAYVSQQVPSVMLALAAGEPDKGYAAPLHHPKVKFDENALPFGAAALAQIGIKYLSDAAATQQPTP